MKATNSTTYRSMLSFINSTASRLQQAQLATATGKKLNKASDDPAAVAPALLSRSRLKSVDSFMENSQRAKERLSAQDTQLDQAENLLQRAVELAVSAGNGIYQGYERELIASELADIRDSLKSIGNGQMDGKYFYSGFSDRSPAFVDNPAYDPILDPRPVLYNGDFGQVNLELSPGEVETVNFTGSQVFLGDADGDGVTDAGQVDIFAVLAATENALRNNDISMLGTHLDDINKSLQQVSQNRSQMGVVANRLERSIDHMGGVELDLKETLSRYEDADLLESITQMTQQEQALQAAMDVTGRLSKLSILDYLR